MKNRKISLCAVIACAMMLTTISCIGNKSEGGSEENATEKKAEAVEETTEDPDTLSADAEEDADDEGYPSTYEQPEGKVLELLKDYNAHMDDYNTTGVTALGMGFQKNRVLLIFSVDNYRYDLNNKAKLKSQARELIGLIPVGQRVAWRCIPDEGHELKVTFVGKQSSKIVSVVFSKEELKELL